MNKRPKEIQDILDYIEIICPAFMLKNLKAYITRLEDFEQSTITVEEKYIDDGK